MSVTSKIIEVAKAGAGSFRKSRSGNAAMMFAMAAFPAVLVTGVMLDQAAYNDARARYQSALDLATLEAIQYSLAATEQKTRLAASVAAQTSGRRLPGTAIQSSLKLTSGDDGSISTDISVELPRKFLQLAGVGPIQFSVQSGATRINAVTPTTAEFKMRAAKGWYWKRLILYVVDASGVTNKVGEWIYQPFNQNYSISSAQISALSWPMNNNFVAVNSSSNGLGTLTGPTTAVSLGENYRNAYLTLEVSPEACAPDQMVDKTRSKLTSTGGSYNPVYCTTRTSGVPEIWSYSTNDAKGVAHMVRYGTTAAGGPDGTKRTQYTAVQPIQLLIPCSDTPVETFYGWEDDKNDGAPSSVSSDPWYSQDFIFSMKAAKCDVNKGYRNASVRLVR